MQQHVASFIAHNEVSTSAELPGFIRDEFGAFIDCGMLAHGILRQRLRAWPLHAAGLHLAMVMPLA